MSWIYDARCFQVQPGDMVWYKSYRENGNGYRFGEVESCNEAHNTAYIRDSESLESVFADGERIHLLPLGSERIPIEMDSMVAYSDGYAYHLIDKAGVDEEGRPLSIGISTR